MAQIIFCFGKRKLLTMKTQNIFLIWVVVFTVLLFIVPHSFISGELGNTILTIVGFLFGIIAGFYVVITTTDYNDMKNFLASETGGWISLHQDVLIYDKQVADKLSLLIDEYIRRNFNFEIINYAKSTEAEFEAIKKFIRELPMKKNLLFVYGKTREIIDEIISTRQQLIVLSTKMLSLFSWTILFVLAGLFIFSLYGLRTGELFFDVVTVAISSSTVLILLLIRDLDLHIWNERTFSYDIFENVLKSIGQLPYYPAESIKKGRIRPYEKEYRVGIYINFPKSFERRIEIRHQS